jgi:hypothetical protein
MKLKSVELFRELREKGANDFPSLPPGLVLDTSTMEPVAAAKRICEHFGIVMGGSASRDPYV